MFYKWTVNDPFEDYYDSRANHPNMRFMGESGLVSQIEEPPIGGEPPTISEIHDAIFFLSTIAPDALFRIILSKPYAIICIKIFIFRPYERTPEELELVYEELLHVKALAHLSTMVKRELASVIMFEQHAHAGTVLFHQGDEGKSWYIILKGSVNVAIHGKVSGVSFALYLCAIETDRWLLTLTKYFALCSASNVVRSTFGKGKNVLKYVYKCRLNACA